MTQSKSHVRRILHNLPLTTMMIIAVNIVVALLASGDFGHFALDYGLVPSNLRIGRFITASFIHDGFLHLFVNMSLLYVFGSGMERAMGRLEFGLFYIGACLAASTLHVAMISASLQPYYATRAVVGASGAVAGVMGLYAVRYHRKVFRVGGVEVSALFLILLWLMAQVGFGALALHVDDLLGFRLKQVAYWSHLGGFIFGVATALIANMGLQGEREHLIAEGRTNYEHGNLLEAAQSYESLLKYDPDNSLAHAELGRIWALMDEEGQSLPYYRNAVRLYIREGKEDLAIAAAAEMKRFWPDFTLSPAKRFRLASYLEELGRQEHAIAAFAEIAQHSPESNEAQMSLLKIGQLQLTSLGDASAAISTLTDFLERYPDSEWRLFAEGTLERARGRESGERRVGSRE